MSLLFEEFQACSPSRRADLIDQEIERAVASMQSVIELGRYIRDQKVIPTKVSGQLTVL